jgi:tetratricopeptide (TPR) repeat protein/mono/diheme cytochrome c family protein
MLHIRTAMTKTLRAGPTTLLLMLSAVALLAGGDAAPQQTSASTSATASHVTFSRDIAPIIYQNCASCHRPGESGPFPLLTYQDVKKHANQIVAVTHTRFMPPWLPEPGDLKLQQQRRLSDAQIALIQKWVSQGATEGSPRDLPPKPHFVEGWQLGTPDLIVTATKPYTVPAAGGDSYWNFILPIPVDRVRWVRAVEIRTNNQQLIHHANVIIDRYRSSRRKETEPGVGFGGMELQIDSEHFEPDSHFLFLKPGTVVTPFPAGMGLQLNPGTDFVLNVHLQPSGKPEVIQPSVGIYFTDQPATLVPMLLQLDADQQLDIPPGDKNFVVSDTFTLPIDVDLLAVYPHAHYLAREILAFAVMPDGSSKTLLQIKKWDLNWQEVFRYVEPVRLPKGTAVTMRYAYDNSEDNIANPNHPPQRVKAGNRASDEMAHFWLQVLPANYPADQGDPRLALEEALMMHHVEKSPMDFEARYNLGAVAQTRGNLQLAQEQYAKALEINPEDAVANNSLGTVLLAEGSPQDALPYLRAALKARPDYFDAHYNLGIALASTNDMSAALEQFREAVRLDPSDAGAQASLGMALAELGQLAEAKSCLERAVQLDPENSTFKDRLQAVEQMMVSH